MNTHERILEVNKVVHISYLVMFREDTSSNAPFSPIIWKEQNNLTEQDAHLFDPSIKGVIPAIKYILHLPRIGFDAIDINSDLALAGHDCPHDIILFPSSLAEQISLAPQSDNALLIYEDGCETEASYFSSKSFIDVVPVSGLSSELLSKHWRIISQMMRVIEKEDCLPVKLELFNDDRILAIPSLFLLNHIQKSEIIFDLQSHGMKLFSNIYDICISVHSHIRLLNAIEKNPELDFNKAKQEYYKSTKIPVVITMLGRPAFQRRFTKVNPPISETEREVCRLMAVHRACARSGVIIEYGDTPKELFVILEQLEEHCKSRNVSNTYVWSTLNKIGKIFTEHIETEKGICMVRSSHITAFTDFPIGLAILPSGSSPLCCYTSISYRPITPMTRALQLECPKVYQHYIGNKCKIVIAECIDREDRIRALSEGAWQIFAKGSETQKDLSVILEEVNSVADLKRLLSKHHDTDILVISAHGAYAKESNVAGLCIGRDVWMGDNDDMQMPPLIMLSACHVSPRGAGSVNVADLLLRAGATAVLGTFIPIDVRRNSLLYIRFFSYIQAAIEGNKSYLTVLDAWTGVVATNAVNEIVSANDKLLQWYMARNRKGTPRLVDFMMNRSVGRLHGANIYKETVQILREMAAEDNYDGYFDAVISSQGFFPESLFYQMIGSPENIFLYHPVNEKLRKKFDSGQHSV